MNSLLQSIERYKVHQMWIRVWTILGHIAMSTVFNYFVMKKTLFFAAVICFETQGKRLVQPKLFQSLAAAAVVASVSAAYALTNTTEKNNDIVSREIASLKLIQARSPPNVTAIDTNELSSERDSLKSKLHEVTNENSKFKDRLDEMNNYRNLLRMELQSVEGQLTAERSRCSKLEMQIAKIQIRLETFSSVEHELEALRRQKLQIEDNMTASQRQSSGGIWGWMAGTAPSQVQ